MKLITCPRCNIEQQQDGFYRSVSRASGLSRLCKQCVRNACAKSRPKTFSPDAMARRATEAAKWKASNAELKKLIDQRSYWKERGDTKKLCDIATRINVLRAESRAVRVDRLIPTQEKDIGAWIMRSLHRSPSGRTRARLSKAKLAGLALRRACAVTGMPIQFTNPDAPDYASVDRIDCSLGYTDDNVRIVAQWVNFAMNRWGTKPLDDYRRHLIG